MLKAIGSARRLPSISTSGVFSSGSLDKSLFQKGERETVGSQKRFLSVSSHSTNSRFNGILNSATSRSTLSRNAFSKDFFQQRRNINIAPGGGIGPSNVRDASKELAKSDTGAVEDPSATLKALENVVLDRDGNLVNTNYSLWQFFDDYCLDPLIKGLEVAHQAGVPHWLNIIGAALVVRIIVLPMTIKSMQAAAMMGREMPKTNELFQKMNEARQKGNPVALKRLNDEWMEHHSKSRVGMFTPLKWGLAQSPFFLAFYFSIKKMVETHPTMMEGGIAWFSNLAAADPMYRLQTIAAIAMLLNFEYLNDVQMKGTQHKIMRAVFAGGAILATYVTADFPMGVHLYWTSSMIFTMAISAMIRKTGLRQIFGIPQPLPQAGSTPPGVTQTEVKTATEGVVFTQKPKKKSATILNPSKLNEKMK